MAQKKKTANKSKKNTQARKEVLNSNLYKTETGKIIKCIAVVLVIFVFMYLLTVVILNHSRTDYITKETETTSIQYDEILAGTSFSKKDSEYLVLFYNMKEDKESIYGDLLSDYQAKDDHLPIYYVNLDNAMNKGVIGDDSNPDASNAEELKIHGATLIRFINNKIEEYLEGEDAISKYLNN